MSRLLTSTSKVDGYFMPAQWHEHTRTWMLWPERTDTWRLGAKPVQEAYARVAEIFTVLPSSSLNHKLAA